MCVLVLVIPLVGSAPSGAAPPGRATATASPNTDPAGHDPAAHHPPAGAPQVAPGAAAAASTPAGDLALRLQALLAQHSILAADMMRGRLRADDDLAQVASTAIGRNTDAMAVLVAELAGQPGADQFKTLWSAHVTALFNYSRGLATKDQRVTDEARTALATFENNLAGFFSEASRGRLPRAAAEANVLMHVDQLLKQADAYAARDYATAERIYREAYTHTSKVGRALAGALLPADQVAALDAPTWRLRSELGRLLGEHVLLAVSATRAGVTNAPDFTATAASLNANTGDLAKAVDSLFGAAAAADFQSLWAEHVEQLMSFSAGVALKDEGRRTAAVNRLRGFESRFATFLETATGKRLDSATLAKALVSHDEMLVGQIEAFAARNYQQAHDLAYSIYEEMFGLAGQLADAFGATVAARLPSGGAETGHGGMSDTVGRR